MDNKVKLSCYTVTRNEIFGRYLIANRDIKQGEVILKERPLIIGASIQAVPLCFKCTRRLHTNIQICSNCHVATVCSKICTGDRHSPAECKALSETGLSVKDLIQNAQVVMPLRCILLRKYNPEKWGEFMQLEPHLDKRRGTWIWNMHKATVQRVLEEANCLSQFDVAEEVIQKTCGILDVNSFEVRAVESQNNFSVSECLRGVYLQAALMAHDCVGNTHLAVDDDFTLLVHASRTICKGETIFFNYSNAILGSRDRQHHLKEGKYFDCTCRRCTDPTELATDISSLVCTKCQSPSLRPSLSKSNGWECSECHRGYSEALVASTVNEAKRRIEELDSTNIQASENLVKNFQLNFHPNHFLILELEQSLVALYTQNAQSIKNVIRKIDLCKHLLSMFKVIEPGLSRMQAITMYELHGAEVQLAQKLFNEKQTTSDEFVKSLLCAETTIKEAIKLLLYEPTKSPEGRLTQRAMQDLRNLRSKIAQVELESSTTFSDKMCHKKKGPKKTKK